jgi:hypothetical protein
MPRTLEGRTARPAAPAATATAAARRPLRPRRRCAAPPPAAAAASATGADGAPRLAYVIDAVPGHAKDGHPECPDRVAAARAALAAAGLLAPSLGARVSDVAAAPGGGPARWHGDAALEALCRVHPAAYLQRLQSICASLQVCACWGGRLCVLGLPALLLLVARRAPPARERGADNSRAGTGSCNDCPTQRRGGSPRPAARVRPAISAAAPCLFPPTPTLFLHPCQAPAMVDEVRPGRTIIRAPQRPRLA